MKFYLSLIASVFTISIHAQLLTWSPAFPKDQDFVKITVDATRGNKGLLDYKENVYVHIGLITSSDDNHTYLYTSEPGTEAPKSFSPINRQGLR